MSSAILCNRVIEFFRANPHEELTVEDMAAKFGVKPSTITGALKALRVDERVETVERVSVYRVVLKA